MESTIQLLGKSAITRRSTLRPLRGRKAWGLLAYLLSGESPPSRDHLASLLFADADDPFRALRWNLSELRRALEPVRLGGDLVELELPATTVVDIHAVKASWAGAVALPSLGGELLQGLHFPSSPGFEVWLTNQRRHLKTVESVLREAALAQLTSYPEKAIDSAARLVALEPLDESYQALLVRAYATAGDHQSAQRQIAACAELFVRELGIEPSEALSVAARVSPASPTRVVTGGVASARAQLEAGEAAIRAGVMGAGTECLRRAIAEAHSLGDLRIKAEALTALGSALVHGDDHDEGAAALHESISVAERVGRAELQARACYELGWAEYLAGRYDRAEIWLDQADVVAPDDASTRAATLWARGKTAADTGHLAKSISLIRESVVLAEEVGDAYRLGFSLSSLGRSYLLIRDLVAAREVLERAVDVLQSAGINWLVACPESFLGEVQLLEGQLDDARNTVEHGYATACQVSDPMLESFCLRGLGLVAASDGDLRRALDYLDNGVMRVTGKQHYVWARAWALDARCEVAVQHSLAGGAYCIADLEEVAASTGMNDMLVRAYLYRARSGDRSALAAAQAVARDVDNRYLHASLAALTQEPSEPARA